MIRHPPSSTLFPYPPPSRPPQSTQAPPRPPARSPTNRAHASRPSRPTPFCLREQLAVRGRSQDLGESRRQQRSEEHTSELQSRSDLVCRLLLEKKKKRLCDMCLVKGLLNDKMYYFMSVVPNEVHDIVVYFLQVLRDLNLKLQPEYVYRTRAIRN